LELVNLDKDGRRDFFINLPVENIPNGCSNGYFTDGSRR